MSRYSNRRGNKSEDRSSKDGDDRGNRSSSSSRSGGRSGGGGRGGRKGDPEFIGLGDISIPKSMADNKDCQDMADDLKSMEMKFNLKVFVGRDEEITLKNGDIIMIKFKDYEKAKEWVEGKAFLVVND